ncbi:hypothetical protein [Pseudomonas syringae]|uniref:hypothetical protein n=1 Tax=Pseudomonas syringae TaxID=317 RepID=UPI000CDADC4E|nr:hypothetical protein [Pseudomonas syringae]POP73112.1 hypothetical protein CXB37_24530 [Pseudomonas syringae pv. syringae]
MSASHLLKLLEPLAAIEHERWAHWQKYLHSKCSRNDDGSLTIPSELVVKWEQQIKTSYLNLTEAEKDSDREQVRNYLEFIIKNIDFY